jgi:hypothetical protein
MVCVSLKQELNIINIINSFNSLRVSNLLLGDDDDGDDDGDGGGFVFSAGTTGSLSSVVQVTRVGEVDVTVVMLP